MKPTKFTLIVIFSPGLVADVALAAGLVVVPEQGVPRLGVGRFARQRADGVRTSSARRPPDSCAHPARDGRRPARSRSSPRDRGPRRRGRDGCPWPGRWGTAPAARRRSVAFSGMFMTATTPKTTRPRGRQSPGAARLPQQSLGLAERHHRAGQPDQPGDKARRQRHGQSLARVRRPRGLGNHANEKPDQREQAERSAAARTANCA